MLSVYITLYTFSESLLPTYPGHLKEKHDHFHTSTGVYPTLDIYLEVFVYDSYVSDRRKFYLDSTNTLSYILYVVIKILKIKTFNITTLLSFSI